MILALLWGCVEQPGDLDPGADRPPRPAAATDPALHGADRPAGDLPDVALPTRDTGPVAKDPDGDTGQPQDPSPGDTGATGDTAPPGETADTGAAPAVVAVVSVDVHAGVFPLEVNFDAGDS